MHKGEMECEGGPCGGGDVCSKRLFRLVLGVLLSFLVRKRPQTGWFSDVIKYVIAEYGSCSTAFNSGIHLAK